MHVVDAITGPARADAPLAADAFGVSLTPLERAIRETLATAAAAGAFGRG
jgi:hypothetical protein